LTDIAGQPVQQRLEQAIRHELSVNREFRLMSEVETQRIIREIERLGRGRTEAFIPPSARLADSVVVVRGVVEDVSITAGRSALVWGKINARMSVALYVSEVAGPASYQGRFSAAASKRKGLILFANPKKNVHISAVDRSELLGRMNAQTVAHVSTFATQFFSSLATGPIHRPAAEEGDAVETPLEPEGGTAPASELPEEFPGAAELMFE
jgi:hypothetical protein